MKVTRILDPPETKEPIKEDQAIRIITDQEDKDITMTTSKDKGKTIIQIVIPGEGVEHPPAKKTRRPPSDTPIDEWVTNSPPSYRAGEPEERRKDDKLAGSQKPGLTRTQKRRMLRQRAELRREAEMIAPLKREYYRDEHDPVEEDMGDFVMGEQVLWRGRGPAPQEPGREEEEQGMAGPGVAVARTERLGPRPVRRRAWVAREAGGHEDVAPEVGTAGPVLMAAAQESDDYWSDS